MPKRRPLPSPSSQLRKSQLQRFSIQLSLRQRMKVAEISAGSQQVENRIASSYEYIWGRENPNSKGFRLSGPGCYFRVIEPRPTRLLLLMHGHGPFVTLAFFFIFLLGRFSLFWSHTYVCTYDCCINKQLPQK